MSDSGFATEHWLLEHHTDLQSDMLVEGSQSSDLAGTEEFLAAVQPKVIIQGAASYFAPSSPGAESRRRDLVPARRKRER